MMVANPQNAGAMLRPRASSCAINRSVLSSMAAATDAAASLVDLLSVVIPSPLMKRPDALARVRR